MLTAKKNHTHATLSVKLADEEGERLTVLVEGVGVREGGEAEGEGVEEALGEALPEGVGLRGAVGDSESEADGEVRRHVGIQLVSCLIF